MTRIRQTVRRKQKHEQKNHDSVECMSTQKES